METSFQTLNCVSLEIDKFKSLGTNQNSQTCFYLSPCRASTRDTHVTLQVIGFPCLNDIILIRQAGPIMQMMSVVHITDQGLTFLSQDNTKHVHWAAVPCLVFLKFFFVLTVTLHLGNVQRPHYLRVIMYRSGANVVTQLLSIGFFVFVLKGRTKHKEEALGLFHAGFSGGCFSVLS